ncbi:MAG: type II toxin-antitoxin system VapC family toxin [Anaerolineales bacterium]
MNVVDSSGWLEYFANGAHANFYAPVIAQEDKLLVPVVCLYEVFRRLHQQFGKEAALQGISRLYRGQIVAISDEIALLAADLSLEHHLPMADSFILATARLHDATLWTQDAHFAGLENVKYIPK